MMSQLKLYEHEGSWDKALAGYDMMCHRTASDHSQVTSASPTANHDTSMASVNGQQGLLTALQQLGCRHLIEAYWQGQPGSLSEGWAVLTPLTCCAFALRPQRKTAKGFTECWKTCCCWPFTRPDAIFSWMTRLPASSVRCFLSQCTGCRSAVIADCCTKASDHPDFGNMTANVSVAHMTYTKKYNALSSKPTEVRTDGSVIRLLTCLVCFLHMSSSCSDDAGACCSVQPVAGQMSRCVLTLIPGYIVNQAHEYIARHLCHGAPARLVCKWLHTLSK